MTTLKEVGSVLQNAPKVIRQICDTLESTGAKAGAILASRDQVDSAIAGTVEELRIAAGSHNQAEILKLADRLGTQMQNREQLTKSFAETFKAAEVLEPLSTITNAALVLVKPFKVLSEHLAELPQTVTRELFNALDNKVKF